MQKTALILALALAGCATQAFQAAPQNYRLKGAGKPVEIKGLVLFDRKAFGHESAAAIYINNIMHIKVPLDQGFNGEATGMDYEEQSTAASCTGKRTSQATVEVRCMVFIDNERTVTLTF